MSYIIKRDVILNHHSEDDTSSGHVLFEYRPNQTPKLAPHWFERLCEAKPAGAKTYAKN